MECQICKVGLNGNYEHEYFKLGAEETFSLKNKSTIARLRAAVQYSNSKFVEQLRERGHKYIFSSTAKEVQSNGQELQENSKLSSIRPKPLSQKQPMAWVEKTLLRSRGTELIGNSNPHLIGELCWEQSQPWEGLASSHIERISQLCNDFFATLLEQKAPKEMQGRIWASMIQDTLTQRKQSVQNELVKLIQGSKEFPINYNRYYTDIIEERRQESLKARLQPLFPGNVAHASNMNCSRGIHYEKFEPAVELSKSNETTIVDMYKFSGEEALDCLRAIYKVQYKIFIANVTTQVIERQMIRGLDEVFSPLVVVGMADAEAEAIASERSSTTWRRVFLANRVKKLGRPPDLPCVYWYIACAQAAWELNEWGRCTALSVLAAEPRAIDRNGI
ncbi:hypothetical protein PG990_014677 [Apiospora arundinis]